ncbi:hypothetical protein LTR56_016966 [Elasticomyces elasticus]|nr:hypothetical protein LTR56_016966 [Elasticomyces elasticus]KAK3640460.1 hypothetical protein LTR22_017018 [Elasticomyces elasticus]KAK4931161.1 hypothetical protein LTR49_002214 [Elasticomyces elasticus]KAK5767908.1 hypothetical protein LTS12_002065 [Elasticomyces elasticus]
MDALPQELLDHIGGDCDKLSLLSLRLVNKELAAALRSTFIERYIRKRVHLYSLYGLQKLVDLTADGDLAKHIKEIVLVVDVLHQGLTPIEGGSVVTEGYGYSLCRAEAAWLERSSTEGCWSRVKGLLRYVVYNLERASTQVAFAISRKGSTDHPYGLTTRQQQIRLGIMDHPETKPYQYEACCRAVVSAFFEACKEQAKLVGPVPISELNICHGSQDRSFAGFPSPFKSFISVPRPTWIMLRTIKLYISYSLSLWQERSCWDGLDRFIEAAPNLEQVALAWQDYAVPESPLSSLVLHNMGVTFAQAKLKAVELGPFRTTRQALTSFLCGQSHDLESVKLVEIGLRTGKGWRRVLKAVAERTNLAKIELNRVWFGGVLDPEEKNYMVMDENGGQLCVQKGREAVSMRLMALAHNATFLDEQGANPDPVEDFESEDEEDDSGRPDDESGDRDDESEDEDQE